MSAQSACRWLALWMLVLGHPQLIAAQLDGQRVLWLTADGVLADAARVGLGPAQVVIVDRDEERAVDARALAQAHGASAVVWMSRAGDTAKLYVFHAAKDRVIGVRNMLTTTLDAATAAAIVLSVKTHLWHGSGQTAAADAPRVAADPLPPSAASVAAPELVQSQRSSTSAPSAPQPDAALRLTEQETTPAPSRMVASSARAQQPPAAGTRAASRAHQQRPVAQLSAADEEPLPTSATQPEPGLQRVAAGESSSSRRQREERPAGSRTDRPASSLEDAERAANRSDARGSSRRGWRLELAAGGGVRAAMHDLAPELRFGLSSQLHRSSSAWALGLDLSSGSGFQAQGARVAEYAAALLGVWHLLEARGWRASLFAGPALHWLRIRVDSAEAGAHSAQRLRPHAYAGLRILWQLPAGWCLGAAIHADIPLIGQRYWLGDKLVLAARTLGLNAQLTLGWPFQL